MTDPTSRPPLPEPLRNARALAVEHYVAAAWAAYETTAVFAASWQLVGGAERLAAAGDHVVDEVAGRPVLVVRQEDGALRAFYNVCRHRAGPLATCDGRGAKALRCRYHGWTYSLAGQLRHAPEMDEAEAFDAAAVRLGEVAVREWHGQVFVALEAHVPPFDAVYGGIAERMASMDLARLRFAGRRVYDVACNWKVYVDNFLEGYHLPHVHPGLRRLLDYRAYDTVLSTWHSLQHSPLRGDGDVYGDGSAFYWFVYPNVMLNVTPGRLQTNRVLPLAIDRCRVLFDFFYDDAADVQARIDADVAFSDEVQREDIEICELVQKNLASGAYEPGRLCPRRESGVWHFHELLRAAYAARGGDAPTRTSS